MQRNCNRYKADCVYDRPLHQGGAGAHRAGHAASQRGSSSASLSTVRGETRSRRQRELRLLHIFIAEICSTLPGTAQNQHTWLVEIPKLAFQYDPLLNAILGLSILYLSATEQHDVLQELDDARVHRANYLEATLQEHRKALDQFGPSTAEAASFTSVVLSVDSFASLRERVLEPYEPPAAWFQICKGTRDVTRLALQIARASPYPKSYILSILESSDGLWEPDLLFTDSNCARFPLLTSYRDNEVVGDTDKTVYYATASYIGAMQCAMEGGEPSSTTIRRFILFPMLIPPRFIELTIAAVPRALVILSHYFALGALVREYWWVGDTPRREVGAIATYLGPEWEKFLDWPLQAFNED